MSVPSVILTGEAVKGLVVSEEQQLALMGLPTQVRLGRKTPVARPQAPRLSQYVNRLRGVPIPASCDWYTKAAASIARMYLNDRYGDCVIASVMHRLGVWSANDPDSSPGGVVLATDDEVYQQYQGICGPGDNGCMIADVLDWGRQKGWVAGGQKYFIDGYVQVDWRSKEMVQVALVLFGCVCLGINLPSAWTSAAVWDVTNTRIVGGHDVSGCGYGKVPAQIVSSNAEGVVIMSWGRLYLITWAAFNSTRWIEECYAMVPSFLWTGADKRNPGNVDLETLKADLQKIGGGNLPPLPDPNPPTPTPPDPTPPNPNPPPSPGPVTFPSNFGVSIETFGVIGNVAQIKGTMKITKKGTLEEALADVQSAMSLLATAIADDPTPVEAGKINWLAVAFDALNVWIAIQAKQPLMIYTAVGQLLKDLGYPILPPVPPVTP